MAYKVGRRKQVASALYALLCLCFVVQCRGKLGGKIKACDMAANGALLAFPRIVFLTCPQTFLW
jgi:hypothetical protein